MESAFLGHTLLYSDRVQLLKDHLMGTARLAEQFAAPFGAGATARRCGLLHDLGKFGAGAQARLRGGKERVDHSTAGALEEAKLGDYPAAFCIAGHHAGIPDMGSRTDESSTLLARLKYRPGKQIDDYSAFSREIQIPEASPPAYSRQDIPTSFFFTHMLYSSLVDADWLDTESFVSAGQVHRELGDDLETLSRRLDDFVAPWWNPEGALNQRRCQILKQLMDQGPLPRGLYTLTVPTGGGKTVSSMAFALRHALAHGKETAPLRRIIYIIPYTSIIEQTQQVFEGIFGPENVVAHYANLIYPNTEDGQPSLLDQKRMLACENWDAPVILTTAVQFFESLFSNRSSSCRKLHNIANSVLIFDEAQMLPPELLSPCVWAITELVRHYGCTGVLCTATQPSLEQLIRQWIPQGTAELCPDRTENHRFFRRVTYRREGILSEDALAERLSRERQVLCIVNRRDEAQRLWAMLPETQRFHLSTAMTAEQRRQILETVREDLKAGKACRVISTSLIEAGVDVDFPCVYREIAGLDAMIQAGGRCNREGKRPREESVVHLFETEQPPPRGMSQQIAAAKAAMERCEDLAAPETVKLYFDTLYYLLKGERERDTSDIMALVQKLAFETVSRRFHLIGSETCTIYIPRGQGRALADAVLHGSTDRQLMRKLGPYGVSVYPQLYREYLQLGAVTPISENAAVLEDLRYYEETTGLSLKPAGGQAEFL